MWWLWFRKQVRLRTKPIKLHTAEKWNSRLNIAYIACGWTLFGYVLFHYVSDGQKDSVSPAAYYGRLIGARNAQVIQVRGLTVVGESEYDYETDMADLKAIEKKKEESFYGQST